MRLSLDTYMAGMAIAKVNYPFYALITAAMRQADSNNLAALRAAFPGVYEELQARYDAPGGMVLLMRIDRAALAVRSADVETRCISADPWEVREFLRGASDEHIKLLSDQHTNGWGRLTLNTVTVVDHGGKPYHVHFSERRIVSTDPTDPRAYYESGQYSGD